MRYFFQSNNIEIRYKYQNFRYNTIRYQCRYRYRNNFKMILTLISIYFRSKLKKSHFFDMIRFNIVSIFFNINITDISTQYCFVSKIFDIQKVNIAFVYPQQYSTTPLQILGGVCVIENKTHFHTQQHTYTRTRAIHRHANTLTLTHKHIHHTP